MNVLKIVKVFALLGISSVSLANTGTITITGKIYDDTCVLSAADAATGNANVTVNLDPVASSAFSGTTRIVGAKDFSLRLTNSSGGECYTSAVLGSINPVVTLSAPSLTQSSDGTLLINQAATANEENPVYLQILAKESASAEGSVVDFTNSGGQIKATFDTSANRFYYTARYHAGAGEDTPSAQMVSANVTYNITYP